MVCIAGDIFDGNLDIVDDLPSVAAELRRIQAPLGVYACLGNHDVDRISFVQGGGNDRITNIVREAGVVLLQDEVRAVGENLYVAGRRDARPIGMSAARKPAAELSGGLDPGRALIVLDHQPTQFALIEQAGADLVLCGHTHRGQIFPANLITRSMYKKAGGTHYGYWKGSALQAVVTSGAGVWGPPLRISTNSEVAVIEVSFIASEQ
jgi:predicted MPP superfamily phosphohydrolase